MPLISIGFSPLACENEVFFSYAAYDTMFITSHFLTILYAHSQFININNPPPSFLSMNTKQNKKQEKIPPNIPPPPTFNKSKGYTRKGEK